jgi:uncharacterized membrane protein
MVGLVVLGVVLGLLALLSLLATPFLLVGQTRLRRRIEALERRQGAVVTAPEVVAVEVAPEGEPPVETAPVGDMPEPVWAGPETEAETLAAAAEAAASEAPVSDAPVVFRRDRMAEAGAWLSENWVIVVAATSMALAGVFLVQYSIQNGLLTPAMRVAGAAALGLALALAGDWLRRRNGPGATPSAFAGAGLVAVFAGIVAARQLYGLIGPEAAFAALVAAGLGGLVLGWYHGAFLTAFALVGTAAAPFAVGGSSDDAAWLYGYFPVVAAIGLGVDTVRRWAWVSVLALALGFGGIVLTELSLGLTGLLFLAVLALVELAILIPARGLAPDHDGPTVAGAALRRGSGWPGFPTRLAAGAVLTAVILLLVFPGDTAAASGLAFVVLAAMALALALWAPRAPALSDLAALVALGWLARLALEPLLYRPLAWDWFMQSAARRPPEASPPETVWWLLGLATLMTLAAATAGPYRAARAAAAALVAPAAAVGIELFWAPRAVIGAYPWALAVIALAALMAVLAERFARADGEDRRRAAYAVLSCLSLIALALFVLVTKGALTLALGALVAVAAALDRRYRLPEMSWFIMAGVIVLGWRLVADPGVAWALEARAWEVWAAYGGALAGVVTALRLLPEDRPLARLFLESGLAAVAALFVNALLLRAFDDGTELASFWSVSLNAQPWLVAALASLWRSRAGGRLAIVRTALAVIWGVVAFLGLASAVGVLNPLVAMPVAWLGPPLLDKLFAAYAMPALILGGALWRIRPLPRPLTLTLASCAAGLGALYVGLEIRRAWWGNALDAPAVLQGELYSYTVALMVLAAGLLAAAILRRSDLLRRMAMTVIVLTVAKVFLIDAGGLTGLTRVASFLGLGLALAGTGVLNRWAKALAASSQPPGGPA